MEVNACRICFTTERLKLLSLFSVKIDDKTLAELLIFLSELDIKPQDKLPDMICLECLSQVSSACETKRKCLEADAKLRAMLTEAESKSHHNSNKEGSLALEVVEGTIDQDTADSFVEVEKAGTIIQRSSRRTRQSKLPDHPRAKEKKPNVTNQQIKLPLVNKLSKEFACDLCKFGTKRKKNLERHILAVHMKSFKFACKFESCNREYTTQAALKLHTVRDHDESSPFECQKCRQKFSCQSLFKIHSQRLSCRPRQHKKTEAKATEKKLSCPHCDFKTAHQFSLKQHVQLIHLNIRKTWKCNHCDAAEFSNRISLNQHIFKVHNLSHVRCDECDQAFSNEDQLKAHKESLKCNARQATEDDFVESIDGVRCNLCNRNYRSKKEWITHYFNHHKFNKVCDICSLQLSTYASLKNHKKTIHQKIKAFECNQCPKKFAAKHTLEFHLNTHSGSKPFSCKWCAFKASDRSSVSKHQKKLHAEKS